MADIPVRVQLRRTKGWRMPGNTVSVARGPGRVFGNPFTIKNAKGVGRLRPEQVPAFVVACFRIWLDGGRADWMGRDSDAAAAALLRLLPELRGKNLACWCPLDQPCHADVLLEIANG
jgi:hypothetical protein